MCQTRIVNTSCFYPNIFKMTTKKSQTAAWFISAVLFTPLNFPFPLKTFQMFTPVGLNEACIFFSFCFILHNFPNVVSLIFSPFCPSSSSPPSSASPPLSHRSLLIFHPLTPNHPSPRLSPHPILFPPPSPPSLSLCVSPLRVS